MRAHPWPLVALVLLALSAILLAWARTRPSFDAYGWLVWGYQTLHGHLDLGGAPSWKPLPFVFTLPLGLLGPHLEQWLWMLTDVALSLAGALLAGVIAFRLLHGERAERRWAAWAGALFAALALLGTQDYAHYILSVQSDPTIVSLTLGAIVAHLERRPRWAFACLVLASLGRPEAWPFLGLYAIWAWLRVPRMRVLILAGLAVVPVMWFGIPWITNGKPFVAGDLALHSPRELHSNKVLGTIQRFTALQYLPVWLAALIGVAVGAWRRERIVLTLAAGCVLWVLVEVAFALHGWPALPRYLFEPAGVATALAGVGIGWLLVEGRRIRGGPGLWAGAAVAAVLALALIPGAVQRIRTERKDLYHERGRAQEIALLQTTIGAVGGYREVRYCGEPVVDVEYVSVLAWLTRLDVGLVGHLPKLEVRLRHPIVLFTPLGTGGWGVLPWHAPPDKRRRCRRIHVEYAVTPARPRGLLIHRRA